MTKLWLVILISATVFGQQQTLSDVAAKAYKAEIAREKSGDCPQAKTTFDMNECLSHEMDVTEANYKTYTAALRAILATRGAGESSATGPTGRAATAAENVAAFDAAESAWRRYTDAQCNAVDTYWRGGTIVNSMVGSCRQRLTRARLHELDDAYDMMLHH